MFRRAWFFGIVLSLLISLTACTEILNELLDEDEREITTMERTPVERTPIERMPNASSRSTEELLEESEIFLQGLIDDYGDILGDDFDSPERGRRIEESTLVSYAIRDYELTERTIENDISKLRKLIHSFDLHEEIWGLYAYLMPEEYLDYISHFYIFSDGPEELLAYVEPHEDDPSRWILAVDIQDKGNTAYFISTLIHEFSHILTLNDTQTELDLDLFYDDENEELYDVAVDRCDTYFDGMSCAYEDSYLYEFFADFWGDIYEEWLDIPDEEDEEYEDAIYAFWEEYEDQFVTEYAATSPDEDIAETFVYFVLTSKPQGTSMAEEKILFFYQYPELIQMRHDILKQYHTMMMSE